MAASSIVFGYSVRIVVSIVLIATLIFFVQTSKDAFGPALSGLQRIKEAELIIAEASQDVDLYFSDASKRVLQLRGRSKAEIKSRIAHIDERLQYLRSSPHISGSSYLVLARLLHKDNLGESLRNEIELSVLPQERSILAAFLLSPLDVAKLKNDWIGETNRERLIQLEVNQLKSQISCRIPLTDCSAKLKQKELELLESRKQVLIAYKAWIDSEAVLRRPPELGAEILDRSHFNGLIRDLKEHLKIADEWRRTAFEPVQKALYLASMIVAAALAGALAFKLFFFYMFAPLAARRSPLIVRQTEVIDLPSDKPTSSLSVSIELAPEQELLVVGSFLQSVADGARTSTKFFFSNWHPLTSFLAGLWILTKLRVKDPSQVVLSSTTDPLHELSVVRITAGQSLVILPRHLVGVLHSAKRQPRLRGTWKFDVHALLTLQFRYLAISGPCTLVVSGCRGVRVERATDGRSISQAMTVGFSANLAYSVSRTETFIPYLLGQRPLFNDRFKGPGVVLYQEVPASAARGGFTGRGLQGVLDGVMKAFGI